MPRTDSERKAQRKRKRRFHAVHKQGRVFSASTATVVRRHQVKCQVVSNSQTKRDRKASQGVHVEQPQVRAAVQDRQAKEGRGALAEHQT